MWQVLWAAITDNGGKIGFVVLFVWMFFIYMKVVNLEKRFGRIEDYLLRKLEYFERALLRIAKWNGTKNDS